MVLIPEMGGKKQECKKRKAKYVVQESLVADVLTV
jgi:hypothetical protein